MAGLICSHLSIRARRHLSLEDDPGQSGSDWRLAAAATARDASCVSRGGQRCLDALELTSTIHLTLSSTWTWTWTWSRTRTARRQCNAHVIRRTDGGEQPVPFVTARTFMACLTCNYLQGLNVRFLYVYMHARRFVEHPETPAVNDQARRLRWSVRLSAIRTRTKASRLLRTADITTALRTSVFHQPSAKGGAAM